MKTILITNDDGYISRGIIDLANALRDLFRVVVIAPANEKSACGHGLCVSKPLHLIQIQEDFYKLDDGSPTDCVYIGICEIFRHKKPDLIISGINIGSNMGEDTIYSGTVAGAIEGAIHGVPSIAISQCVADKIAQEDKLANRNFDLAISFVKKLCMDILDGSVVLTNRRFLNVNVPEIPADKCSGLKITHLGIKEFNPNATKYQSPRGHVFHWIGFNSATFRHRDNATNPYIKDCNIDLVSDFDAIANGFVSMTPLQLDLTDYDLLKSLYSLQDTFKL